MQHPSNPNRLFKPQPPWIFVHRLEEHHAAWQEPVLYGARQADCKVTVRKVRGTQMTDLSGLVNEFSAAFQFMGECPPNWNAFYEFMRYLDEWIKTDGFVLVIKESIEVLREEPEFRVTLRRLLDDLGQWWATPITDNGRFNRPAVPFHTVFQCTDQAEMSLVQERFGPMPILELPETIIPGSAP